MLTTEDIAFMSTLNEFQRRQFLALRAITLGRHGVDKVSKFIKVSKNTLYKGMQELKDGYTPVQGKQQRPEGGRKSFVSQHPEWIDAIKLVIEPHSAGLPQDETVIWVSLTVSQIKSEMSKAGYEVSEYIIRQILKSLGFRRRSFIKDLPLAESKDRDVQFNNIADIREQCEELRLPVLSIDTKKKELIGNFKREGKVFSTGQPKVLDHDFETFAECKIIPHGIFDVAKNVGYMTLDSNHDTSEFVSDNIERIWKQHLEKMYPNAKTIVLLCDGGGSNSNRHRIFKQDIMLFSNKLNMNILVMHYPPYCSTFNSIEHRLFSQISRSWSGASLISMKNVADKAVATTTSKGLIVHVNINDKTYDIKRQIDSDYERKAGRRIVHQVNLPKWNYLVKPN